MSVSGAGGTRHRNEAGVASDLSTQPSRSRTPLARRALLLRIAVCLVGGVMLFLLIAGGLTLRWFVYPKSQVPEHADAVFVFAGGRGERLATGRALVEDGVADVLVVNRGTDFDSRAGTAVKELCDNPPESIAVECFVAEPDNTQGEAASFARLAHERGWTSVIAVSTDHHLRRAKIWVERCFDGDVYGVIGDAPTSRKQVEHEWLGVLDALLVSRSCDSS